MPYKRSVRFRLTLWNSGVLALLLGAFAYASWTALNAVLERRGDTEVSESAEAVVQTIRSEGQGRGANPRVDIASAALRVLRAGDLDVFIVDEASHLVASSRGNLRHVPRVVDAIKQEVIVGGTDSSDYSTVPEHVRTLLAEAKSHGEPYKAHVVSDTGSYRAAVLRVGVADSTADKNAGLVVAVIRSSEEDDELLEQVRTVLFFTIPLALLVSIVCGYAIARRSLAPVEAMADQAARISAATLDERLPVANAHDELGRLATVVNALLERVHVAFLQQRQFVADASHELRTPIAIVRGEADVTLQRASRNEAEYREALGIISEESVRLTRIVDDLFLLARTDAGAPVAQFDSLDLRELTLGALRSVRTIADDHDIVLAQELPEEAIHIEGDAPLLRRLLLNLLDNALKYTPNGGRVGVTVQRLAESVNIIVQDTGPGIPAHLRARVFDRFVRAGPNDRPAAHTDAPRASSGAGLGLAIAAAIAAAHHGTLTLDDAHGGAKFRVALPLP